jgi:hypothetical protein
MFSIVKAEQQSKGYILLQDPLPTEQQAFSA